MTLHYMQAGRDTNKDSINYLNCINGITQIHNKIKIRLNMRSKNNYNNNTLFSSKETRNTTEKSTFQKLFLLTSPTADDACGSSPVRP